MVICGCGDQWVPPGVSYVNMGNWWTLYSVSPGCRRGAAAPSSRWSRSCGAVEAWIQWRSLSGSRQLSGGHNLTGDGALPLAGAAWDRSLLPCASAPWRHAHLRMDRAGEEKEKKERGREGTVYLRCWWTCLGDNYKDPSDPPTHQ